MVTSFVVLVHPPAQREGVAAGQPEEHPYTPASPGAQSGAPPSGSQASPQPPQLAAVVYETHPPPQGENPLSQACPHPPSPHVACAFAMPVVQRAPHPPQFAGSDCVAMHPPSQSVGAVSGHVGTQT